MITTNRLQEIIEDAGYEVNSYSGRSMYGKHCISYNIIENDSLFSVADIINSIEDEAERSEIVQIFKRVKTDSMGRDEIVIYFPRFELKEEE